MAENWDNITLENIHLLQVIMTLTTEGAIVMGVVKEAGPPLPLPLPLPWWYWLMRRLDLLLPENDLILLRKPEAANNVLEETGKPAKNRKIKNL